MSEKSVHPAASDGSDGADTEGLPAHAFTRDTFPGTVTLLWHGFTRRCAWCGDRKAYFDGWFKRRDRCRKCGHSFRRGDHAFELGAVTINFILTGGFLLLTILVLVLLTVPNIPVLWVTVAAGAVAVFGPILFYPLSFSIWQAIDLIMRPPTDDELAGISDGNL